MVRPCIERRANQKTRSNKIWITRFGLYKIYPMVYMQIPTFVSRNHQWLLPCRETINLHQFSYFILFILFYFTTAAGVAAVGVAVESAATAPSSTYNSPAAGNPPLGFVPFIDLI